MSMTVQEIEKAIKELPADDLSKLSEWFGEFESEVWDKQIEDDLAKGKLQTLLDEAEADFANGDAKQL
jgi:hypothetical protein